MLCLFRDLSAKISFLCTITLDHHTVAVVSQYLAEVEVPVMADHNPIEHLWDELKKRVEARNAAPTSLCELQTAIKEEWDNIPQDLVKKNGIFNETSNGSCHSG